VSSNVPRFSDCSQWTDDDSEIGVANRKIAVTNCRELSPVRQGNPAKADLSERLAAADEPPPLLHPNMSKIYRQRGCGLHKRVQDQSTRLEAVEVLRQLVDQVTLVPEDGDHAERRLGRDAELCRRQEKARHRYEGRAFWRFWIAGIVGCGDMKPPRLELARQAGLPSKSQLGDDQTRLSRPQVLLCCLVPDRQSWRQLLLLLSCQSQLTLWRRR
jgi:hypothetical protein